MGQPRDLLSSTGLPFLFLGEHPALDFANTLIALDSGQHDLLQTWPDVVAWLGRTNLSSDKTLNLSGARAHEALKKVIALRHEWKEALGQIVSGRAVSDAVLAKINKILKTDALRQQVRRMGVSDYILASEKSELQGGALALALLARQISHFLATANLLHVHRCANPECVLYFYDTTKNHRRQWCSNAACGNRDKVARFRQRRAKLAT